MKESLPINKEILKWARITIGLTSEEVASKMGKSETVILEWESGNSSPTYSQLEKLAYHVYKRPLAVFFFPDIPEEESPRTEFRTLPDVIVDNLPSELIKLYRKAKVFQLNLDELFDGNKPVDTNLLDRFSLKGINDILELASNIVYFSRLLLRINFHGSQLILHSSNGENNLRIMVFLYLKMLFIMMIIQVSVFTIRNIQ